MALLNGEYFHSLHSLVFWIEASSGERRFTALRRDAIMPREIYRDVANVWNLVSETGIATLCRALFSLRRVTSKDAKRCELIILTASRRLEECVPNTLFVRHQNFASADGCIACLSNHVAAVYRIDKSLQNANPGWLLFDEAS